MVWRVLKRYGTGKANEMLDEFTSRVVAFDPETAGKAQTAMMQAELSELAKRLAEAEAEMRRHHLETRELQAIYDRYLDAAHGLEQRIEAAVDDGHRQELETSLARLIEPLEGLDSELAREREEDRDAEVWAEQLRAFVEDLAAKLRHAESDLHSAERLMETAKLKQQLVVERECKSSAAAGLTTALSTISTALDAMNKETARVHAERAALEMKANVLQGGSTGVRPEHRGCLEYRAANSAGVL